MSLARIVTPALLAIGLGGCKGDDGGGASGFEGTWLFLFDAAGHTFGDECEDVEDMNRVDIGADPVWADIYALAGGDLVVLLDEPLTGAPDGSDLTAAWTGSATAGENTTETTLTLTASLADDQLSGTASRNDVTTGEEEAACSQTIPFTAERSLSDNSQVEEAP